MSGTVKALLIFVSALLLMTAGGALLVMQFLNSPASESQDVAVFEVRPGESMKAVAIRLQDEGLISNARFFQIYARVIRASGRIRVGEYAIPRNFNPQEILREVTSGKSIEHSITVAEGLNLFEIADLVEKQKIGTKDEFLNLVRDAGFVHEMLGEDHDSLEGYLFPETYHYTKFTPVKSLVHGMVDRFKEQFQKVPEPSELSLSRHQLVTLASIIEKETGAEEERPMISSVFYNRLRQKMRLQTDPTVAYGIWEKTAKWNRNITKQDLVTPSRYNTYVIFGLPPGPIANPGLEALKAAAEPSTTEYLFFVSRNDGTHVFTSKYADHNKAVSQFQLDRKAREGKSWRDLQKHDAEKGKSGARAGLVSAGKAQPKRELVSGKKTATAKAPAPNSISKPKSSPAVSSAGRK